MSAQIDFELVRPDIKYHDSFLQACDELAPDNLQQAIYFDWTLERVQRDFAAYVAFLLLVETEPPPPFVPDTIYWAVSAGEYVGRICFRHSLNDFLRRVGGHIGYAVRPSRRRLGIGTEMLARVLRTDLARQTQKVLITCDENNAESIRVIEKNGGIRSGSFRATAGDVAKLHYWISTI